MPKRALLEVCVDSVEGVLAAQAGGADRVELSAHLQEGGTTPSAGLLAQAVREAGLPLQIMIRPRGGDFLYSDHEFASMKHDLEVARASGAQGVVLGILEADGRLDRKRMGALVELARPLGVTCHRAFDMARDPFEALEHLIDLGVERVLTSGQRQTAQEGVKVLAELVRVARGRIRVMPGGGITELNVSDILSQSCATEVHAYPRIAYGSRMEFRNLAVSMNGARSPSEFTRTEISLERVRALIQAIQRAA